MELKALGISVGRKRVARLMKTHGLQAQRPRRFRVTTKSDHHEPVVPNVSNRGAEATNPVGRRGLGSIDRGSR
jgi:transposase InsO family protein